MDSSLSASSFQNFSAVCSSHSLSETVDLLSLSLFRLVGSKHFLHLLNNLRLALEYGCVFNIKTLNYYTMIFLCCQ